MKEILILAGIAALITLFLERRYLMEQYYRWQCNRLANKIRKMYLQMYMMKKASEISKEMAESLKGVGEQNEKFLNALQACIDERQGNNDNPNNPNTNEQEQ